MEKNNFNDIMLNFLQVKIDIMLNKNFKNVYIAYDTNLQRVNKMQVKLISLVLFWVVQTPITNKKDQAIV